MAVNHRMLLAKVCIQAQGDLGLLTTYTTSKLSGRRGGSKIRRIIFFPKVWLSDPTSPRQLQQRNAWRAAATMWHAITADERTNWQRVCTRLHMPLTGFNLFVFWQTNPASGPTIATVQRQSGIDLVPTSLGI